MNNAGLPIFIIGLRDSFQGFDIPDIETEAGPICALPAIGTEREAHQAVGELSRRSGLPTSLFRICKYKLDEVMEG